MPQHQKPRRRGRTETGRGMALPLGQCCIFGAAFRSDCAASVHATGPCAQTLPGRSGLECAASVPCECTNNITGMVMSMGMAGVTQAESDEPMPKRLALGFFETHADFQCCMWAGATYSAEVGCELDGSYAPNHEFGALLRDYASESWGPICEYGGASSEDSFVHCQLSCYRNGFTPDGWEAACAKPPPSSPPGPRRFSMVEQTGGGLLGGLPMRAEQQPLEMGERVWASNIWADRMCCPSGSTYDNDGYVSTECVGASLPATGDTSDVMKIAAITCSCRDLCDPHAMSENGHLNKYQFIRGSCSDRETAEGDLHADGDLVAGHDLCDSWASALRSEPDAVREVHATVSDDGWRLLCSASSGMPSFDGFSPSRLLLARQTWQVSSWSRCMYSCHTHGYTHDQWNTQCGWPSPPPSLSAPLPLSLVTRSLPSPPPDSSSEGCDSGCIGSIIGGIIAIVFLVLLLVGRFYPGMSFCRFFKCFLKEEDRQQRESLRTDDVSLHPVHGRRPLSASRLEPSGGSSMAGFPPSRDRPTAPTTLTADARIDGAATATHEIPARDIVKGLRIGQGGYGVVFHATWKGSNVAVKVLKKNSSECQSLQREAAVLSQLRHPRLVSFFGTTLIHGELGIVMEVMGVSLYTLLDLGGRTPESSSPHKKLDATDRYRIAHEVAAGIAHLHDEKLMHRDVKTSK